MNLKTPKFCLFSWHAKAVAITVPAGSLASQRAGGGKGWPGPNHWEAEGPLLCLFQARDDKAACLKRCQSLGGSQVGGHWEWQ